MRLIFSFDTEEYETPGVDDAVKVWADMLAKYGFRGCFCTVGEKARVLRDRGRQDVIDSLGPHEIDYHSDGHSRHPVHAEFLDEMSWDEGVARVITEESRGIQDVETILGSRPLAYCKPGASWGPQVAHAMARMGLPVFCDSPFEYAPGQPLWYCGQLLIGYHIGFDNYFDTSDRLQQMQKGFRAVADRVGDGTVVMWTHPVRLFTSEWAHNYRYGVNTPREEWIPAPIRPRSEIDELIRDFDAFVGWVSSEGIEVIDYAQLLETYRQDVRWATLDTLTELAAKSEGTFTWHTSDGTAFSPAEIFALVSFALEQYQQTGSLPLMLPVRQPTGPVRSFDFLREASTVPARDILNLSSSISRSITEENRIPDHIVIDHSAVSPGSYLKAASELLGHIAQKSDLPQSVTLDPNRIRPELANRDDIAGMRWGWSMLQPGFEGKRVIEAARLQIWTAKPALKA